MEQSLIERIVAIPAKSMEAMEIKLLIIELIVGSRPDLLSKGKAER